MHIGKIHITQTVKMWLRVAAVTLVYVFIVPSEGRLHLVQDDDEEVNPFAGRVIDCVIATSNDMYSHTGLKAGFNYEMLKVFAQAHDCTASIRVAGDEENVIDSLISGAIDILVLEVVDTLANYDINKSRSVDRYCAWYLNSEDMAELRDVNTWLCSFIGSEGYKDLRNRFYTEYDPRSRVRRGVVSRRISPYDDLIKQYSRNLGWDWRLLAAQIYHESRYSINSVSFRGARGLMQIIPSTAKYYGVTDLLDPEQSLMAGTKHLARLQRMFSGESFTPEEKINFTLAAYNAGESRIADCRIFAARRQLDSTKWSDIVRVIPDMRKYTMVSADSTSVRESYFRGTETINYVESILDLYDMLCQICPEG